MFVNLFHLEIVDHFEYRELAKGMEMSEKLIMPVNFPEVHVNV